METNQIENVWISGKNGAEELLRITNVKGDGFAFGKDDLMKICLVFADANLKNNFCNKSAAFKIRNEWKRISDTLIATASLLAEIGMNSEILSSYAAVMPIAYYLFKGGKIEDEKSIREVRKFLCVSFAKNLICDNDNETLTAARNTLKNIDCTLTPFTLAQFRYIELTGGRTFSVTEADIEFWLNNYEKGQNTYILLSLLYPYLKLSQYSFHQDHCHPYAGFEEKYISDLGLPPEKIEEWKKKRNLLPNLQFLEGAENESKNQTPLKKWVSPNRDFSYHPKGVSLELKDFDTFYAARKALMKNKLMEIFEI